MLRLIIGKAGTGKTAAVIAEINEAVHKGLGGSMLIVPEQYSHEVERELCARCGDSLSLYAEVFSFTGLARRVLQQQGGVGPAEDLFHRTASLHLKSHPPFVLDGLYK